MLVKPSTSLGWSLAITLLLTTNISNAGVDEMEYLSLFSNIPKWLVYEWLFSCASEVELTRFIVACSKALWKNLAKICVKTRRLDVARVCLSNSADVRIALALRRSSQLPELDAQTAILAAHLDMPVRIIYIIYIFFLTMLRTKFVLKYEPVYE